MQGPKAPWVHTAEGDDDMPGGWPKPGTHPKGGVLYCDLDIAIGINIIFGNAPFHLS